MRLFREAREVKKPIPYIDKSKYAIKNILMGPLKKSFDLIASLNEIDYFLNSKQKPTKKSEVKRSINVRRSTLRQKYVFTWSEKNLKTVFEGKAVPYMMPLIESNIDKMLVGKRFSSYLYDSKSIWRQQK